METEGDYNAAVSKERFLNFTDYFQIFEYGRPTFPRNRGLAKDPYNVQNDKKFAGFIP